MFRRVERVAKEGAHLAEEGFEEGEKIIKEGARGLFRVAQATGRTLSRDVAPKLMQAAVGLERGTKQMIKNGGKYATKAEHLLKGEMTRGEMLVREELQKGETGLKRGLTFAEHEARKGATWVGSEGGKLKHALGREMSVRDSSDDEGIGEEEQQTSPTPFHDDSVIDTIFRCCRFAVFTKYNFDELLIEGGHPKKFNLDKDDRSTFQTIHLKDCDYFILHIRNKSLQTIVLSKFHPAKIVAAIHISGLLSRPDIFPSNYENDQTKREWIDDTNVNLSRLVFTPDERGDDLDSDDYLDIAPETQVALIIVGDTKPTFFYSESDFCIPALSTTHHPFPSRIY